MESYRRVELTTNNIIAQKLLKDSIDRCGMPWSTQTPLASPIVQCDREGRVKSVVWSHDTTRLASASTDKTVKIWDSATGQCVSTIEIGRQIDLFQLDRFQSDVLHTELGAIYLRLVANPPFNPLPAGHLLPEVVGYGLGSNNTWITYSGKKLIWLPPEYRVSSVAISGTNLSIGCSSGRVLIFKFSDRKPIP